MYSNWLECQREWTWLQQGIEAWDIGTPFGSETPAVRLPGLV